jgi:hypothetical protein
VTRRLALRREALAELPVADLSGVGAGRAAAVTTPATVCLTHLLSCYYC